METANEQSTNEIQPSVSRADASHQAAGLAQRSDHSAFGSNQGATKADFNDRGGEMNEHRLYRASREAIPNTPQVTRRAPTSDPNREGESDDALTEQGSSSNRGASTPTSHQTQRVEVVWRIPASWCERLSHRKSAKTGSKVETG